MIFHHFVEKSAHFFFLLLFIYLLTTQPSLSKGCIIVDMHTNRMCIGLVGLYIIISTASSWDANTTQGEYIRIYFMILLLHYYINENWMLSINWMSSINWLLLLGECRTVQFIKWMVTSGG